MNSTKIRPKQYLHRVEKGHTSQAQNHTLRLTKGLVKPPHHSVDIDHHPPPLNEGVRSIDIFRIFATPACTKLFVLRHRPTLALGNPVHDH